MGNFLYYIPKVSGPVNPELPRKHGLGYAFERRIVGRRVMERGPDGDAGLVVASSEERIGYFKDKQAWRKVPGTRAWVGMYCDAPPLPADLGREQMLPGHSVRLGDEQYWTVPVARALAESDDQLQAFCALPSGVSLDDNGQWTTGEVVPRYRELWKIATDWFDTQYGEGQVDEENRLTFEFAEVNDAALTALAANYRIGKAEVALLGLFTQQTTFAILQAVIDQPTLDKWVKKKLESGTWNTAGGEPAEAPTTDPA